MLHFGLPGHVRNCTQMETKNYSNHNSNNKISGEQTRGMADLEITA